MASGESAPPASAGQQPRPPASAPKAQRLDGPGQRLGNSLQFSAPQGPRERFISHLTVSGGNKTESSALAQTKLAGRWERRADRPVLSGRISYPVMESGWRLRPRHAIWRGPASRRSAPRRGGRSGTLPDPSRHVAPLRNESSCGSLTGNWPAGADTKPARQSEGTSTARNCCRASGTRGAKPQSFGPFIGQVKVSPVPTVTRAPTHRFPVAGLVTRAGASLRIGKTLA
jgi:hypothetical protein